MGIFSEGKIDNFQTLVMSEFKNNREEISSQARNGRDELSRSLSTALSDFGNKLDKNISSLIELQSKNFDNLDFLTKSRNASKIILKNCNKNLTTFFEENKFEEIHKSVFFR